MSSLGRDKNLKSEVAKEKPRDQYGHFIKEDEKTDYSLEDSIHFDKKQQNLLDIHVGNPLERITQLLEDIKKQKAFNFSLKGSLGLAGVAVALSVFGIFGGSKVLCDKGIQTEVGIVKILNAQEPENSNIPVLGFIIDYLRGTLGTQTSRNRVILQTKNTTITLPFSKKVNFQHYNNKEVFVTGNYDNCSRILKVENIEITN